MLYGNVVHTIYLNFAQKYTLFIYLPRIPEKRFNFAKQKVNLAMNIEELYAIYREHPVVTTDSRKCPEGSIFFEINQFLIIFR